jgi:fatty acyl-ACP thioesterase A
VLPSPRAPGLAPDLRSFCEEHRIRAYEVGPDQRTTIVTIANLLQEVAGNHGVAMWGRSDMGFATDPIMVEHNLIFVVTRMQMRMDAYPQWGDLVSIETWFQKDSRISFERNWDIRDVKSGRRLGMATSTWIMLDTKKRRPARCPESMVAKLTSFSPQEARHIVPEEEAKQKLPDFPEPPEIVGPVQVARRSDVDMNQHLNNVTYLAWCLETVPLDVYTSCQLHQVEIDYKAECAAGDTVDCFGARLTEPSAAAANVNGTGTQHLLHTLQRGGSELVRCRTAWRPTANTIAAGEALGAGGH